MALSFDLTILELFDGFTSLRVAGCLSAALKGSQMKGAINIVNYIHILSLQKKYHQDTCKIDQMRAIQKFHAKTFIKNSINISIMKIH